MSTLKVAGEGIIPEHGLRRGPRHCGRSDPQKSTCRVRSGSHLRDTHLCCWKPCARSEHTQVFTLTPDQLQISCDEEISSATHTHTHAHRAPSGSNENRDRHQALLLWFLGKPGNNFRTCEKTRDAVFAARGSALDDSERSTATVHTRSHRRCRHTTRRWQEAVHLPLPLAQHGGVQLLVAPGGEAE